jgi:hypothetical protein
MPLSAFVVGFSALLDRIEGNGVKIVLVEDARLAALLAISWCRNWPFWR